MVLRRLTLVLSVVSAAVLGVAGPVAATWSIVAVDEETGRVGAVMASCVEAGVLGEPDQVLVPVVLVPTVGAGVTQATIDPDAPATLRRLLLDGLDPDATVERLLADDEEPTVRQYAVVGADVAVDASTYTGTDAEPVAAAATGPGVAAQGVLLADRAVVTDARDAYLAAVEAGEGFEAALVAGLAAGSAAGGDRRCGEQTALFAHLAVAGPADDDPTRPSVLLTVTVDEGDGQNPVPLLATALADGESGWVDAGGRSPVGVSRLAVGAVATLMAAGAFYLFRKGLGSPSARR